MPQWLENAVFYEIYPQSFYDTNGDGIGDLEGVIQKLDYISGLGCNALWLNPCFASPFNDAGYDVSDYRRIAPRYGTNADARRLFEEAHRRGMHVLLDLVAGHTSIEHPWFRASMAGGEGEYADRYIWAAEPWERFEGISGVTGSINGICQRGSCAVNFYSTQPALNYGFAKPHPQKPWQQPVHSPAATATRQALWQVMCFWLEMGCDGFRVDMAGSLVKNDEGQQETIKLWQGFRERLDAAWPEAALISEWGQPKRALEAGFHMDFLLHFGGSRYLELFREKPFFSCGGGGDIAAFVEEYLDNLAATGAGGHICIPTSNHDMPRISRHLTTGELKLAFAFVLAMPGVPFIYYGDEIGMRYLEGLPSLEGGYERTGSRTPMQWDATLNAGFSSAPQDALYLPLDPDENRPTVAAQLADEGSLLNEVKRLTALRMAHPALQSSAPVQFIHAAPGACPLVFRRGKGAGAVTVALNPSHSAVTVPLPLAQNARPLHHIGKAAALEDGALTLAPESAAFYLE